MHHINMSQTIQENKRFTVTIIGLGNIGLLYDFEKTKDSGEFLTHTRSTYYHKNFEIKFLIDNDQRKLELAKKKYGSEINYFDSLNEYYIPTDIVVLSSYPEINSFYLNKLKNIKEIKLFLIEKPFLICDKILSKYKGIIDKTYINYYRKSLPFYKELKNNIDNYKFGDMIGVNIFYSKGLNNNGSHLIDLMNYLFKSNYNINSINIINFKNDYFEDDESITFSAEYNYNNKPFTTIFHALDENKFSLIELDIIFDKKRFRIFDFGGKIEIYNVESDKTFSGYKNLIPYEVMDSNINYYGMYTYDTIYSILNGSEKNYSTLIDESKVFDLKKHVHKKLKTFKKKYYE